MALLSSVLAGLVRATVSGNEMPLGSANQRAARPQPSRVRAWTPGLGGSERFELESVDPICNEKRTNDNAMTLAPIVKLSLTVLAIVATYLRKLEFSRRIHSVAPTIDRRG